MSSFHCEHCGIAILDTLGKGYITGCEHYPIKGFCDNSTCEHVLERIGKYERQCKFCKVIEAMANDKTTLNL